MKEQNKKIHSKRILPFTQNQIITFVKRMETEHYGAGYGGGRNLAYMLRTLRAVYKRAVKNAESLKEENNPL